MSPDVLHHSTRQLALHTRPPPDEHTQLSGSRANGRLGPRQEPASSLLIQNLQALRDPGVTTCNGTSGSGEALEGKVRGSKPVWGIADLFSVSETIARSRQLFHKGRQSQKSGWNLGFKYWSLGFESQLCLVLRAPL